MFGARGWGRGGGFFGGWVELAEEAEALEFGDGFVEAVLQAAFVHEEAVEDAGAGEVLDDDATEGEVAVILARIGFRWGFGEQGFLQAGEGAGGVFGVEGVEGLVHASEIPDGEVAWRDLEPGSPITLRVLKINRWRRRIALSLRSITQEAAPPVVEDAVPVLVGIV